MKWKKIFRDGFTRKERKKHSKSKRRKLLRERKETKGKR